MSDGVVLERFSASDAALEGFQTLRRHWRVLVGWAGFNLMALVAMVVVSVIGIMVTVALFSLSGSGRDGAGTAGAVIGGLVGFFGTLGIQVCVVAGLFRLLLTESRPEFFYLRLGRDEARLVLVWLMLLALACGLAFGVVGLAAVSASVGSWAPGLISLAGVGLGAWIFTRLSLSAPLSFAEQRLGFAAAWRLSRGRFWPLLGMNLLALCLVALVAVAAWLGLFLLMAAASGFHDFSVLSLSDEAALTEHPLRYLVQLVAELAFAPVLWTISQAPLAAAYKAFAEKV
jgi:hypothetical protein